MRVLITAGPTREYLDAVRYLSNASSGAMGYALAEAVVANGHEAVLVSGPVSLPDPPGCVVHRVETTSQMLAVCLREFHTCDGVIGAAAVCDYRPKQRSTGKLKKTGGTLLLELEETEDILEQLGRQKKYRWIAGFALEAEAGRANALRKLVEKNCDVIALNAPTAIGAAFTELELLTPDGHTAARLAGSKHYVAERFVLWILTHLAAPGN